MCKDIELERKRFYFIDYLKAFAAILVINSHFDSLYPISEFATGGAIGNALFFAVSGFCLLPIKKKFGGWYIEKVIKLYVPTVIMTIILIIQDPHSISLSNAFFTLIWPTRFWFIGAIILFYLLFYLMKKVTKNWHFALVFLVLSASYFIYYFMLLDTSEWVIESGNIYTVGGFFRLIYYFAAMMIGKYFRLNVDKPRKHISIYVSCIIFGGVSLYFVKFLMNKNNNLMHLQFLNQFSVLIFVIGIFLFGLSIETHIAGNNSIIYKVFKKIGALTLYLYIVQFPCIHFGERFGFPVNALIALVLIGVSAILLQKISGALINFSKKKIKLLSAQTRIDK